MKIAEQIDMEKYREQDFDIEYYRELENGEIYKDLDEMKHWIRDTTNSVYHPTSTCKIGDITKDDEAVVGLVLKVRFSKNLRVCDASIFETGTTGNTQAPCYMVSGSFL